MSKSRDIADSAATINFIDGVTSDVQTQLDSSATAGLATAGPITTPVVTANSIVATVSATLGAVGDVTITGGTADQYLQTDGSGNLSFADVATGGLSICATTLQSCVNPVLNLAQGNYFKIRATSNTHLDVTGAGTSLKIDYLSNCYGVLNLPNSFTTEGATANAITELAINNRYLLEYEKVNNQWIGGVKHLSFHPSCEIRHAVSKGYSTCNWLTGGEIGAGSCCMVKGPSVFPRMSPVSINEYYCHEFKLGGGGYEGGMKGMASNNNRSLSFTYKNKPYTIAPTGIAKHQMCAMRTSCNCQVLIACADDAKGIVLGYDACGFACEHQLVDYFTHMSPQCSHRKLYIPAQYAVGAHSVECCVTDRCHPGCGTTGTFRPIAVWPSRNLLINAELLYTCCRNVIGRYRCLALDAFIERGEYKNLSSGQDNDQLYLKCWNSAVCNNREGGGSSWLSLSVSPNVDFDKCSSAVIAHLTPLCSEECQFVVISKLTPKVCNTDYPDNEVTRDLFCLSSCSHDLRIGGCRMFFAGQGQCDNSCLGDNSIGTITMTANSEYVAVTGIGCTTNHCYTTKVAFFRDCQYGNTQQEYTNIGNCCFITRRCGGIGIIKCIAPSATWDCQGCHLAFASCKQQCCNGFGTSIIFTRNEEGTGYLTTYCCCWCTDCNLGGNPTICCNQWPVSGAGNCQGPILGPIDVCGSIHCLYSAAASTTCCSTCSQGDLCGLSYDTSNCTWTVGTQAWKTDCGANTAPDKLFWYSCEYSKGTTCCCGGQQGCLYTFGAAVLAGRGSDGAYINPRAIHPLSNTELYSI